jgi:VanZ family protein
MALRVLNWHSDHLTNSMGRFLRAWLPVIGMCVVIFLFSMDSHSMQHSNWVLAHLLKFFGVFTPWRLARLSYPFRKFAHLSVYAVLALLTYRAFALDRGLVFHARAAWLAMLFCAFYAATDEFHQSFVPGRTPAFHDVVVDVCGAGLALLFLRFLMAQFRSTTPPRPPLVGNREVAPAVTSAD